MEEKRVSSNKEEDVAAEAFDLVEHALSLIDSNFYEDALIIVEQAKELFKEINRMEEVEAIDKKISELQSLTDRHELSFEKRKLEETEFEEKIRTIVDEAESLAREHEKEMHEALNEGRVLEESKYPKVIQKYEEIIDLLKEKGWTSQIEVYEDTINNYRQKLESEEKVKKIEKQKKEEQQKHKGYRKLLLSEVLKILEGSTKDDILNELREKGKQASIDIIIESIENELKYSEKEYQKAIKQKNFDMQRPHEKIIMVYQAIQEYLKEQGNLREASLYNTGVEKYKQEIIKDEKIRKIEAEKIKKQEEFESLQRADARTKDMLKEREKQFLETEREKKENLAQAEKIFSNIEQANQLAEDYELKVKSGDFSEPSKFLEVIELYETSRAAFKELGWNEEANKLNQSIQYYKEKVEEENKLKHQFQEKIKENKELEEGYNLMDQALDLVESNEVQGALSLYERAREIFKKLHRDIELDKIRIAINVLNKSKEEYDEQIKRTKERQLKLKREQELMDEKSALERKNLQKELQEKQQKFLQLKEKEEREKSISSEALSLVNRAEEIVSDYEMELKKGKRPECAYYQAIELYEAALSKLRTIGWEDEVIRLKDSIVYYKGKCEEDERFRDVELFKKEEKVIEKQAYDYMGQAYGLLRAKNFEESLKFYERAKTLFEKINRDLEVEKIKQSISELKLEREGYLKKAEEVERKRQELINEQKLLESRAILERKTLKKELEEKQQQFFKLKEKEEKDKITSEKALSLINQAEEIAKSYEENFKRGYRPEICPYEQVIHLYQEAASKMISIQWNKEAQKLQESINYYEEKLENDRKYRELEHLTLKEAQIQKEGYRYMDQAVSMMKKKNFEESLKLYEKAKELFQEINSDLEIQKVTQSIAELGEIKDNYEKALIEEKERIQEKEEELKSFEAEAKLQNLKMQKSLEEKQKEFLKTQEEDKKQQEIYENAIKMINRAEKIARNYEEQIKNGKLVDSVYDEVIDFYKEAIKNFEMINQMEEVERLKEAVTYYQEKIDQDRRLRTFIKTSEQERDLTDQAYQLMDKAVTSYKMKRFEESIAFYKQAREIFAQINHDLEIEKINLSLEEVEKEHKNYLERIEQIKKEKEQEKLELQKLEEEAKTLRMQIQEEISKKNEQVLKIQKKEQEKKKVSNQAIFLIKEAETLANTYEEAMRQGKRPESVYPTIIEKYQKAIELFTSIDWMEEAKKMQNSITFYQNKLEREKLLREKEDLIKKEAEISSKAFELMDKAITSVNMKDFDQAISYYNEAKDLFENINRTLEIEKINISINEVEREKELFYIKLESLREKREKEQKDLKEMEDRARASRIEFQKEMTKKNSELLELTKKEQEKKEISKNALSLISQAENIAESYEVAIKEGKHPESIYPEVIRMHEEALQLLRNIDWKEEASRIENAIQYYKGKLEQDERLREHELTKKKEGEILAEGYNLMEKAISRANMKSYDESIMIYKKALALFESINRELEIEKILISIMELQEEQRNDQKKLEAEKKRKELELLEQQRMEKKVKLDRLRLQEDLKKKKEQFLSVKERAREEKEKSEKALSLVNQAEKMAQSYEIAFNEGKRPECAYPEVVRLYQEAAEILEDIGWNEEKLKLKGSIIHYQDKLLEDMQIRENESRLKMEGEAASEAYQLMEKAISLVGVQEYNEALKLYENAKEIFQSINRPLEMEKIDASIRELNRINEEKLLNLKRKKMEELQKQREKEKYDSKIDAAKLELKEQMEKKRKQELEIQQKVQKERAISKEAFSLVNQAEMLVEDYNIKVTKGESPELIYDTVISLYQKAAEKLKSINWKEEERKLLEAIELYTQKKKDEEALRQLELEQKSKEKELNKVHELMEQATDFFNKRNYKATITNYQQIVEIYKKIGKEHEALTIENLILGIQEKKEAEIRALEEEEKYRKEMEKELLERQKELTLEYNEEQKRKQQEREQKKREKIEKQKESVKAREAYEYINKAEDLAKEYNLDTNIQLNKVQQLFDNIIDLYDKARELLQEIQWTKEATTLQETINYYKEKLDADVKYRELENERLRQEQKELKRIEELNQIAKIEEELQKERETQLLLKAKELTKKQEEKKNKAFEYLDQAKNELANHNYDEAHRLYQDAGDLFTEIEWEEGIVMINESLKMIEKRKIAWQNQEKEEERRQIERKKAQEDLEQKIAEFEKNKKEELEKTKVELEEKQKQEKEERDMANKAYSLLEEGTRYVDYDKFEEAEEKYIQAREIFGKLGWTREVSKINNESLLNLKRKKIQNERSKEEQRKAQELKEQREKELELQRQNREEALKKLRKIQIMDKIDETIQQDYESAQNYLNNYQFNKGIIILKDIMIRLEKAKKSEEVEKIMTQISQISEQSRIPLITLEKNKTSEEEAFTTAWKALDNAQVSLTKNMTMKAISELNEALFNIKQTQFSDKYLNRIVRIINELNKELGREKEIQLEVEPKESKVEISEKELIEKVSERRKMREKRILDLLKKKEIE